MTIADRVRENLKLAQDHATPYVESAQRSAGVAFASVQEKLGRTTHGGMHHSASSKDVTVRCFAEPNSGSQLPSAVDARSHLHMHAYRAIMSDMPPDLPRSPFIALIHSDSVWVLDSAPCGLQPLLLRYAETRDR